MKVPGTAERFRQALRRTGVALRGRGSARREAATHARRRWLFAALVAAGLGPAIAAAPATDGGDPVTTSWVFEARLDGKPIGEHRFTLRTDGGERELHSVARFDVKILGFTAYRYRHDAVERWQGDCLVALDAKTDDNGKAITVRARKEGDTLVVQGPNGRQTQDGCAMSFAYWNKAMLRQTRLLNAQTGEFEAVRVEALGGDRIDAQGRNVEAEHVRLTGPKEPIELWYAPDGEWLALESSVSNGKRKLRYVRR